MLRRLAMVFLALGAALIAFSATWLAAVSPSYRLLRPDYHRIETLTGTFRDWDSASSAFDQWPVTVRRQWRAEGSTGTVLALYEETSATAPGDVAHFAFPDTAGHLNVDRKTGAYLSGLYGGRRGHFSPPPGLKPGDSFTLWVQAVLWAIPLKYESTESVRGVKVLVFRGEARDLPLDREPSGITQHGADIALELLIEPRTGYVVDRHERVAIKVMDGKLPVRTQSITDLWFSEEEVARQARLARGERLRVVLLGTFMPWAVLGLGALLSAEGLFLLLVASWRRRTAHGTSDAGGGA